MTRRTGFELLLSLRYLVVGSVVRPPRIARVLGFVPALGASYGPANPL